MWNGKLCIEGGDDGGVDSFEVHGRLQLEGLKVTGLKVESDESLLSRR